MNGSLPDVRATARPPGLIDTLQAGFNTTTRNAWLLVLPIAVDLIIWLGPQVTVGPLVERWLVEAAVPPGLDSGLTQSIEQARRSSLEFIRRGEGLSRLNLLSLLAIPVLGVPSFRAGAPGAGPITPVASTAPATAVVIASLLIGLCFAALFYGMLGQAVREGRALPHRFIHEFGQIFLWLLTLGVLLVGALLGIGVPTGLLLIVMGATAPVVANILGPILLGIGLWIYLYLFFTTDALFVSRVPPLVAVQHSIAIVRYNFWSTLGFIVLLMIISAGFPILWHELADNLGTLGVAVAIIGHIFISSGLAAGSMTYYKDRFERLRAAATG